MVKNLNLESLDDGWVRSSIRKSIEIRNRVSIGDESVQVTRTAKFLGLTIDSHLTFKDHVEEWVRKGRCAAYTLIKLKRAGVPPTALVEVYCTSPSLLHSHTNNCFIRSPCLVHYDKQHIAK